MYQQRLERLEKPPPPQVTIFSITVVPTAKYLASWSQSAGYILRNSPLKTLVALLNVALALEASFSSSLPAFASVQPIWLQDDPIGEIVSQRVVALKDQFCPIEIELPHVATKDLCELPQQAFNAIEGTLWSIGDWARESWERTLAARRRLSLKPYDVALEIVGDRRG